jgi:hypothetical protein
MDREHSTIEHPAANARFEPTRTEKFSNAVLNTAGNVEPYSLERPLDSSLAWSSAAASNPIADASGSSYAPARMSPDLASGERQDLPRHEEPAGFFERIKEKVNDLVHGHEDPDRHSAFQSSMEPAHKEQSIERSDNSNSNTGGSWIAQDKSHSDSGSLPFALDKDVAALPDYDSSSSSNIVAAPEPVAFPHPAAENTSDFSFWQPPADAPVEQAGFATHESEGGISSLKENVSEMARHAATWEGK